MAYLDDYYPSPSDYEDTSSNSGSTGVSSPYSNNNSTSENESVYADDHNGSDSSSTTSEDTASSFPEVSEDVLCSPSLSSLLVAPSKYWYDDNGGENGLTCSLCLQNCEMSGDHRLCSLKCGHFFGECCIRKRLNDIAVQIGIKVCPECKAKAREQDIRHLYAKRLEVVDRNIDLHTLQQLYHERKKNNLLRLELITMKKLYYHVTQKLKSLEADNESLEELLLDKLDAHNGTEGELPASSMKDSSQLRITQN